MCYCGRMEKIKRPEKLTNEQFLERIGEKKTLTNNILCKKRQLDWSYYENKLLPS